MAITPASITPASADSLLNQAMGQGAQTAENPYQFPSGGAIDGIQFPAMMEQMGLQDLPQLADPNLALAATRQTGDAGAGLSQLIGNLAQSVSQKSQEAGNAVSAMMSGQDVPIHQAMIAIQESSVSFQLMVEVRNKLLESYQEMMRMQV